MIPLGSTLTHTEDLPKSRQFDGRTYRFHSYEFGPGAKQGLQRYADQLKDQHVITNYRIVKYKHVNVRTEPRGIVKPRTVYALYTR